MQTLVVNNTTVAVVAEVTECPSAPTGRVGFLRQYGAEKVYYPSRGCWEEYRSTAALRRALFERAEKERLGALKEYYSRRRS